MAAKQAGKKRGRQARSKQSSSRRRRPAKASAKRASTRRRAPARKSASARKDQRGGPKGPVLLAGAAAAALIGRAVVKSRRGIRKRILGVPVPTSRDEVRSLVKHLGKATKQAGTAGKDAGKEIQRMGAQAEDVGKTLS